MDDHLTSKLIEKYGENFGHMFNKENCSRCGIRRDEFTRKVAGIGKKTTIGILCDKTIEEIKSTKSTGKKRIQNIRKAEFWKLLLEFHDEVRFQNGLKWVHSFKETYEWFWDNHKVNRSTFAKMFAEIYIEQKFGEKNTICVYGAPTGSYEEKDRLPVTNNGVYREWSLWGFDDFNPIDERYTNSGKLII